MTLKTVEVRCTEIRKKIIKKVINNQSYLEEKKTKNQRS